ncbi:MAG: DUF882 domain-containing protein [Thermodesulfobacteriota bacterium]
MRAAGISRRAFCTGLLGTAALLAAGRAAAVPLLPEQRQLSLEDAHTGERVDSVYWADGRYDPEALAALNRFFRCHYRDEVVAMDPGALDLLCDLWRSTGADRRVRVISGYRSPAYNEQLRKRGRGVAKNSLHLEGKAIDFLIPGLSNRKLAQLARSLAAGGVGSYPTFVHIDTGPVRSWRG